MDKARDDVVAAMAAARVRALRTAVLALHKSVLDAERTRYELAHGTIESPQHALRLVMDDPFFAWLRPLSDFVIRADIRLSDGTPMAPADVDAFARHLRALVQNGSPADPFATEYRRVLQSVPEVIVLHGQLVSLLG